MHQRRALSFVLLPWGRSTWLEPCCWQVPPVRLEWRHTEHGRWSVANLRSRERCCGQPYTWNRVYIMLINGRREKNFFSFKETSLHHIFESAIEFRKGQVMTRHPRSDVEHQGEGRLGVFSHEIQLCDQQLRNAAMGVQTMSHVPRRRRWKLLVNSYKDPSTAFDIQKNLYTICAC